MTNNLICDIVINTNEVVDIIKIVDPSKPSEQMLLAEDADNLSWEVSDK